ncbi:hypothetical protein AB7360_17590 [Providencia alcalifaciens]
MTTMKEIKSGRIQILTEQEIHELYSRPIFNQIEREEYFSLVSEYEKNPH